MTALYSVISLHLWKISAFRLEKKDDGKVITMSQLEYISFRTTQTLMRGEIRFLQELAFRSLCEEVIEFSQDDIEELDRSVLLSGEKIMHLMFLRTSDSSVRVPDRTVHFIHLTYQEFFAAQYFVEQWISSSTLPVFAKDLQYAG